MQAMAAPETSSMTESAAPKAIALHLYPTHFTLLDSENTYQYNGPLKTILDAINRLEIPPEAAHLLPSSAYHQGAVHVDVYDHRRVAPPAPPQPSTGDKTAYSARLSIHSTDPIFNATGKTPSSPEKPASIQPHRVVLKSTAPSLFNDLSHFGFEQSVLENTLWTKDASIEFLSRALPIMVEPLCLDPTIEVLRQENAKAYNSCVVSRKRRHSYDWADKEDLDSKKQESNRMMLLMGKDREFFPQYKQMAFVDEWRRKKRVADSEPLTELSAVSNTHSKADSDRKQLVYNVNRRIIRTLKFHKNVGNKVIHTVLNIYDMGSNEFEGVLRWGEVEGTSMGSMADTIQFSIGNRVAVEYYVGHFRGFYGANHQLISDVAAETLVQPGNALTSLPQQQSLQQRQLQLQQQQQQQQQQLQLQQQSNQHHLAPYFVPGASPPQAAQWSL
ncbi:hypothetical protein BASA50_006668 [Batrachochytrium salamandrivorans]|uniref:Spt20-like SEP domain-containing protein n=1 Tax=Batrachochytrium salamandrivorans TaxID=1357716 RepID=A0ABQ8F9B7_9FUNG|nr:hypothetical protein BASA60_005953 [Batrachochytrium salamandrivorans]KAH6594421.1 hypothetical protein BASA50_006668 [Batrachochytrium salamandrivorans]